MLRYRAKITLRQSAVSAFLAAAYAHSTAHRVRHGGADLGKLSPRGRAAKTSSPRLRETRYASLAISA